jgi:hypothetical protein
LPKKKKLRPTEKELLVFSEEGSEERLAIMSKKEEASSGAESAGPQVSNKGKKKKWKQVLVTSHT